MSETVDFLILQVEALKKENQRLNDELGKLKTAAFETRLSDSTFCNPEEIEVVYELISKQL
jgi:hypothetical protein